MSNKNFTRLNVDLALGPATVTLKKQDTSDTFVLGITTEDQAPTYTEDVQVIEKTTTTFGSTPVQRIIDGEIITFTLSVVLDLEAENKMSDILQITNDTKERNALVAGKELSGYIVNIHPNGAGGDRTSDINLVNATIQIVPNRIYNTEDDSSMTITFTALPAERDMDDITAVTATVTDGGSLPTATYIYKVEPRNIIGNVQTALTTSAVTTETTNLSVTLEWETTFGAENYRIYRSDDSGTSWKYWDVVATKGDENYKMSYLDLGTQTVTAGTPVTKTTAKVYSTVVYGQPIEEITLSGSN